MLDYLPDEIIYDIMQYLDLVATLKLGMIATRYYIISNDHSICVRNINCIELSFILLHSKNGADKFIDDYMRPIDKFEKVFENRRNAKSLAKAVIKNKLRDFNYHKCAKMINEFIINDLELVKCKNGKIYTIFKIMESLYIILFQIILLILDTDRSILVSKMILEYDYGIKGSEQSLCEYCRILISNNMPNYTPQMIYNHAKTLAKLRINATSGPFFKNSEYVKTVVKIICNSKDSFVGVPFT
jgi:hypothetical protein